MDASFIATPLPPEQPAVAAAVTNGSPGLVIENLLLTPGALDHLGDGDPDAAMARLKATILPRFLRGDWGDMSLADQRRNHAAVHDRSRILAVYNVRAYTDGFAVRLYITHEFLGPDQTRTTVMLAEEY